MADSKTFASGAQLLDALKSGELSQEDAFIGMVKASDKQDHIAFAPGSCDTWVDVPAELISDVEVLRHVPCRDHSHPLVRLRLKIDESNPVHTMVRQLFLAAVSRAGGRGPLPLDDRATGLSPWSGAASLPGGQQGQQLGSVEGPTWMFGPTDLGRSPFIPSQQFMPQVSPIQSWSPMPAAATAQFASMPGKRRIMLAAPIGPGGAGPGTGGVGFIECDLDCCVACCRDCFPWIGCVDYPCCKLSNCKISF